MRRAYGQRRNPALVSGAARVRTLRLLALLVGATIGASAGCGTSFHTQTPPGFVALREHDHRYDYRATTADGVVVAVREIDNDVHGDEAFWSQAIALKLHALGGYALLDQRIVTCQGGLSGRQMRFGHDEGTRPHLYVVTIFVTTNRLYLVEAGGAKDRVSRDASKLDAFVASFAPTAK
jgi:hypothetical protein